MSEVVLVEEVDAMTVFPYLLHRYTKVIVFEVVLLEEIDAMTVYLYHPRILRFCV